MGGEGGQEDSMTWQLSLGPRQSPGSNYLLCLLPTQPRSRPRVVLIDQPDIGHECIYHFSKVALQKKEAFIPKQIQIGRFF